MRTVDVLIAALAIVGTRENWTQFQLVRKNHNGGECFCAMGATLKAGGCFDEDSILGYSGARTSTGGAVLTSGTAGLVGFSTDPSKEAFNKIGSLSKSILDAAAKEGIHMSATDNALKYLRAAMNQLANKRKLNFSQYAAIHAYNDALDHEFVVSAFKVAISNAKRRHINGDRKKIAQQEVSQ